jgi:hypothetical protein
MESRGQAKVSRWYTLTLQPRSLQAPFELQDQRSRGLLRTDIPVAGSGSLADALKSCGDGQSLHMVE